MQMCKERSDKNVPNFRPGHTLENPVNSITEKFLFFLIPLGKRNRGDLKICREEKYRQR